MKIQKIHNGLKRKAIYSIDRIRDAVENVMFTKEKKDAYVIIDGDIIKGNSERFQTFFTKGIACACCGLSGNYFAKEKHKNDAKYHLNLYAVDKNGNEILMTKDHIIPKSKGGANNIDNYQTMCQVCNEEKRDKL